MKRIYKIVELGGSFDAENIRGLVGKFLGGASDLGRWASQELDMNLTRGKAYNEYRKWKEPPTGR
jgi:hypothetical protein